MWAICVWLTLRDVSTGNHKQYFTFWYSAGREQIKCGECKEPEWQKLERRSEFILNETDSEQNGVSHNWEEEIQACTGQKQNFKNDTITLKSWEIFISWRVERPFSIAGSPVWTERKDLQEVEDWWMEVWYQLRQVFWDDKPHVPSAFFLPLGSVRLFC